MIVAQCDRDTHIHRTIPFIFRIQKLAMISIHMIMTRSLGMTTPMRTSTVLGVLEKWLPIGMASVVSGLLMVPKWEVSINTDNRCL